MLLVPEGKLMVPVLGVLLAVMPPILIDGHSSGVVSGSRSDLTLQRRSQLLPWQGTGLATAVIFAVIAARYAIFDMLHMLLNRRPSEALATGALLLAASLGCIPLVSRYYKGSQQAKRALLLIAAAGLLLMLLRPPLPVSGGAECPKMPFGLCPRLWNERHAPQHEEDDVSIYGDGLRRREHWPLWLLAGAAFSGLVAATSPPARQIAPLRLGEAAVAAFLVAGYMALEFFPGMPLVQAVIGSSALLTALAVVLIQVPSNSGKMLLPVIIVAWAGLLPGALMSQVVCSLPPLPAEAHRLLPEFAEGVELEEERKSAVKSAIFASFAAESLLLAFALKLRVTAVASGLLPASGGGFRGSSRSSASSGFAAAAGMQAIDRAADFLGRCMPAYALQPGAAKPFLQGPASAAMQRLTTEGMAWAPTAYPVLFRNLSNQRRYFPPTVAIVTLLLGSVAFEVYNDVFGYGYFDLLTGDWYDIMKNVGFTILCVPSLIDLLWFIWVKHRLNPARAIVPAAVASLGIFMADFEATRLLAGVCAAGGVYLAATAQQRHQAGRKLI
ncbi:hypothetical protein Ndes2526B_g07145 [Nannochloris sp. 'desiccata']